MNPYLPRRIDRPSAVPLDPRADLSVLDDAKILAAPDDPALWPAWRTQLDRWRDDARRRLGYDGSRYDTERGDCLVVDVAWLWDELLYDHDGHRFTVDRYAEHAVRRFGGFDGVLLWHAYPIEGIDARHQFDFYRDVPELPDVVHGLQHHGMRVFVAVYPWESAEPDPVVDLVAWSGADGVFFDSAQQGPAEIRTALDELRPGLSTAAESRLPLTRVHDHTMSWAQWCADSPVPGVLRAKWFERRHVLHHVRRWNRTHLDELQSAWLNGSGVLVWESVFGVWVGWSGRDRAVLRSMRDVHSAYGPWLRSERWTPLADHPGDGCPVYASRWEHDGVPLWTIANRSEDDHDGPWLLADQPAGLRWAELTTGADLTVTTADDGRTLVGGRLAAGGIAAVTVVPDGEPVRVLPDGAGPVRDGDRDVSFPARAAVRVPAPRAGRTSVPAGAASVEGGRYELVVRHRVRETGLYREAPYVDEWKPLPPRLHHTGTLHRSVYLARYAICRTEVSKAEYATFLSATGYRPGRPERFLADWRDGRPEPGGEDEPVTHVELADARVYARWAGLRLPSEDEWQVAASMGRLERRSPLVWNLTESEHSDGRTRFCILKGGCAFRNDASDWYFDGGPQPAEVSATFLLAGAGISRSPSIGFRCAADLAA